MQKKALEFKGKLSRLELTKTGQHVGIKNTEHPYLYTVFYEDEIFLQDFHREELIEILKSDTSKLCWELPDYVHMHLATVAQENKDIFYGIIYPNEKKFNPKLWRTSLIAQELAAFNVVSEIRQWQQSTYINLIRDYEDRDLKQLFNTAYNWQE